METNNLLRMQESAKKAGERMLMALLDYEPCAKLTVSDIKFIADWTRTVAFDAIKASQS